MIEKVFLGLAVLVLIISCAKEQRSDISYTISPIMRDSVAKLQITMRFDADSSGVTKLHFNNEAWGESDLFQTIDTMALLNVEGQIEKNQDSGWILIKHPKNIELLKFEYILKQDFESDISTEKVYRPIINESYFHVFSHNLFMLPEATGDTLDIDLSWNGFSEEGIIHNSFGSKQRKQFLAQVLKEEFGSGIFVGGDFRILEDQINGNEISLATRGSWVPFKEEELMDILKNTLRLQRDFWQDHSQEYFTVTMQPFPQENGSSFQGTGLTNSFATSISNNEFTDIGQLVYLFNHELMHNWIGHTIQNENEEAQYWFSEGFTEYYAFKNIAKNSINGLDGSYYIQEINNTIRNLNSLSIRNASNTEINYKNFWTDRAYSKLPYYRGAIFAFYLDHEIQNKTNDKHSLDDVMLNILNDAKTNGQLLSHNYFVTTIESYLGEEFDDFFERHIENGDSLPLIDFFEKLHLEFEAESALFELGFELTEDRKAITSVVKGSEAEKAGLIVGDELFSRSIWMGDVSKKVQLGIIRNGEKEHIAFLPIKMAKVPQLKTNETNLNKLGF